MGTVATYPVTIFGQTFNLVSDESSEKVEAIASQLDLLMKQISHESGLSDCKKVAMLAAVQLLCKVDDLEILQQQSNQECHKLMRLIDTVL